MARSLVVLVVLAACDAPPTTRPPEATVAVSRPAARPEVVKVAPKGPSLDEFIKPWHVVEAAWKDAPVWLVTQHMTSGSCEADEGGGLVMYRLDRFIIGHVLRGEVTAREVTVDGMRTQGASYPRSFAEGRHYLLFIRPGELGERVLADPRGTGLLKDRLGPDEVLAIVDLDASEEERTAEAVVASRSGEHAGFRFDQAAWTELRTAREIDAAQHRGLIAFLEHSVLVGMAPLAEVRAWLGPPDRQETFNGGARRDSYVLARGVIEGRRDGLPYGTLDLWYDHSLRLGRMTLEYTKMKVKTGVYIAEDLTPTQRAKRGLPSLNVRWEQP